MTAGRAILEDLLADRDVTADRSELTFAVHDAAEHLGQAWEHLADKMSSAVGCMDDAATGKAVVAARQEVARATEVAFALFATLAEHTPGIAEAEEQDHRFGHWPDLPA